MHPVVYVPKPSTVKDFGSETEGQLSKWVPEICGVCCLKMIGDTYGNTQDKSLWALTKDCINSGAFVEDMAASKVSGIYYKPLIRLSKTYGLTGKSYKYLPNMLIKYLLHRGINPILSIDLNKVNSKYTETHLIVIVSYDKKSNKFTIHDPSSVLGTPGDNVKVDAKWLKHISNNRGMSFRPKSTKFDH